jgi:hypothetical protein
MRERVLNRGIPAPRDTLLLQFSQKHKCRSMFFLRFGGRRHVVLIAVEKTEIEGPHTIRTKHTAGDNRSREAARWGGIAGCGVYGSRWRAAAAGGLVLPPERRGAFVGQRARDVGQKETVFDLHGDSGARRRAQRPQWRPHEIERPTPSPPRLPVGAMGWKMPFIAREKGKMSSQRHTSVETLTMATTHTNQSRNQCD